jgi:hypothetical protein
MSWRGTLAALASRGERTGPRVDECREALSRHQLRTFLIDEWEWTPQRADALIDGTALADAVERKITKTPGGMP